MSFLKRLKKRIKKLYYHSRENILLPFTKVCFISIGENCLPDDILRRHNLKSFSTIYSHGRSNIDYINQLEENEYIGLLDIENLKYEFCDTKVVVKSKKYRICDDIFHSSVSSGFEFTHHDVIGNDNHIASANRKIQRLIKYKGQKSFVMLYHHRFSPNSDLIHLLEKMKLLQNHYLDRGSRVAIIVFTQRIIDSFEKRGIECVESGRDLYLYTFNTLNVWEGGVQDIFWARCDDDLILEMLKDFNKRRNF